MTAELTFGQWLKQRRRQLDLTQNELAQQAGCSLATIRKIEQDARRPSKQLAELMAVALDIPSVQQSAFITFARTEAYMAPMPDMLTVLEEAADAEPPQLPEISTAVPTQPLLVEERRANGETREDHPSPLHNLPPEATPFLGRKQELENLNQLLVDTKTRLVAIVGAGGMGKTRLALALAEQILAGVGLKPAPTHGVFFVNLAPLSEARHIVPTLADVLAYQLVGDAEVSQKQLLSYLRQKEMMLIFDNFEHLLDGADLLAEIVQTAPDVQIVVTSRERLHLRTEQVYPIEGLEFPSWDTVSPIGENEDTERYTAVQLFLQSAQRNQPDFALQDNDLTHLTRICRLVAGMPLAIELAAAWVDMLPLADIATELQQGLDILETELRDIPQRHRSIRAAIDYSWHKLDEREQAIFAKLSVFRGGFTREAAQAVVGANLRQLARLINKSLLQIAQDKARYELHPLLQEYGREKLHQSGEIEQIQNRHLDFFLKLAEAAEPYLESKEQLIWMKELEIEYANLRTALIWSHTTENKSDLGLRLASALFNFYATRNNADDWLLSTQTLLAMTKSLADTMLYAQVVHKAARVTYEIGDYSQAHHLLDKCISSYRKMGLTDHPEFAQALSTLGIVYMDEGDYAMTITLLKDALAILQAVNDIHGVIRTLRAMGWCTVRMGDFEQAKRYFEEALPLAWQFGNKEAPALVLSGLGEVALRQNDYDKATGWFEEALALHHEAGYKWGIAALQGSLGWVALRQGDLKQAVAYLKDSLSLRREINDRAGGIAWCLEKLAEIALLKGQQEQPQNSKVDFQRATKLFSVAEALRMSTNSVMDLADKPEYERQLLLIKKQLGEATFARAWFEGKNLDVEETAESLLTELENLDWHKPAQAAPIPHNLPQQANAFIGRERELASLNQFMADPETRLITIIGAGGMGKTRLALAMAEQLLTTEQFANGVFFVNLAPLSEARHIVPALAGALAYQLVGNAEASQKQLLSYLRQKEMLLIFDNFEHLLDGADLLAEIVQTAPDVQILVTSRERLHLRTEQVYPIKGLEFPDWETPEDAAEYTAVQLFLQSARRNQPDFALHDKDDLTYLARICRTVVGMPLALELAASWVDMLPLQEIADELQQGLDFLETDMRDMPERHRSVRAAIDYSWQKLDKKEQDIFAKLSVFRGGFTREAAKTVADASLRQLARLVSKSLLQGGGEKDGRFQIHELLRQFAAEKLQAINEEETLRKKHSRYYTNFLYHSLPDLKGSQQLETAKAISTDIDNIRAAWQWAVDHGDDTLIAKSWETLFWYYDRLVINYTEGETISRQAITLLESQQAIEEGEATATKRAILQGLLIGGVAVFCFRQGRFDEAMSLGPQSIAQLRQIDREAQAALALSLAWFAGIRATIGEYEAAIQNVEECLAIFTEADDLFGQMLCVQGFGYFAEAQGNYSEALEPYRRCIEMCQQMGESVHKLLSINALGRVTLALGDYLEARKQLETSLYERQKIGHRFGQAGSLIALGELEMVEGNLEQAAAYFQESQKLAQELNMDVYLGRTLIGLGSVARLQGNFTQAERLLQESLTLWQREGNSKEIAASLNHLGSLAFDKKAYRQAEQLYQESLSISQEFNQPYQLASTWRFLGYVAVKLGHDSDAKAQQYFHQALVIASQGKIAPIALDILCGYATLLLSGEVPEAKRTQAIELLILVQHHSASEFETVRKAKALFADEGVKLPSEMLRAAQIRGQELDLWQTAEFLLTELSIKEEAEGQKARVTEGQGRFVQKKLVATGGFGEVYQGLDNETGQGVVIKRLRPELVAQQPDVVARFMREGKLLRQLNHPNIVQMIATETIRFSQELEGEQCLIMEYVAGGSLRDLLDKEGQLSVARTLDIALELADALSRAHHLDIIHRDLKPSNVLLAEDGTPRLTDFGIARMNQREGTQLTQEGAMVGTIDYMSPEACQGLGLDGRSDIWSFGILLYEMLTGQVPFQRDHITATIIAILGEPTPDLLALQPDVPAPLVRLIEQMLVKEPEQRISQMRQVAADLERIRRGY